MSEISKEAGNERPSKYPGVHQGEDLDLLHYDRCPDAEDEGDREEGVTNESQAAKKKCWGSSSLSGADDVEKETSSRKDARFRENLEGAESGDLLEIHDQRRKRTVRQFARRMSIFRR